MNFSPKQILQAIIFALLISGACMFVATVFLRMDAIQTTVDWDTAQILAPNEAANVGSVNAVAGIVYYLYGSGVGSSDTSVTLTSFKQPVSSYKLTMTDFGDIGYLTLEPGNSTRQEFVSFTGISQNTDGTATLTGVTRGLGFVSPYTASSSLQKQHSGGSQAVISNPPQFYERFANKLNDQQITGVFGFNTLPTSSVTCSADYQFCTKSYIDAGFNAGAATSTFTRIGLVQIATDKQMASSSASSSVGAPLVLLAKFASTTPGIQCSNGIWNCVPVGNSAGKIAQSWLDLSQAFTFTGGATTSGLVSTASSTFTASTTLQGTTTIAAKTGAALVFNGVVGFWPSSQGAAASLLQNDGSGNLSWSTTPRNNQFSYSSSTSHCGAAGCTLTQTIFSFPAGTFTASSTITFQGSYACANGGTGSTQCLFDIEDGSGNVFASHSGTWGTSQSGFGQFNGFIMANNSTSAQRGTVEGFTYGTVGGSTFLNVHSAVSQTVNMANATSIVVRFTVNASANASGDLNDFSIIVRP